MFLLTERKSKQNYFCPLNLSSLAIALNEMAFPDYSDIHPSNSGKKT